MRRHVNIPIFIPHLGCPNQCVFCNQRFISGVTGFDVSSVPSMIDEALLTVGDDCEVEIAFFGGSFTGIDRELMTELLSIAYGYITRGRVKSIRCSTRPDYIDEEVLDILKRYGVKVVELGLQSISEGVLNLSKRGHDFSAEERACRLIVDKGFTLVGQMMIGLPGSTPESEEETARFICSAGASGARIYPTVVFKNTELYDMTLKGEYTPLCVDEAILRSKNVLRIFTDSGVKVIRIGLCASENLSAEDTYYAGPNHSALGELIEGEVYYDIMRELISKMKTMPECITVFSPKGAVSKVLGQRRKNKTRILNEFGIRDMRVVEDNSLTDYRLKIKEERKEVCT